MLGFGALAQFSLVDVGSKKTQGVFSSLSQPTKKSLAVAVIATTFVGFVAPQPVQARVFTQFSQPKLKKPLHQAWLNSVFVAPQSRTVFSSFSQPQFGKPSLPSEQPGQLFVGIPQSSPFTGFARFSDILLSKPKVHLFSSFNFSPFVAPPDTHDGGWVKKRKKKPVDSLALKLEEQLKRRADIELAVYGPEVKYEITVPKFEAPKPPADIGNLPQIIALAEHQNYLASIKQADDDEEDELAMILKDL
jgi:hypothetical protein